MRDRRSRSHHVGVGMDTRSDLGYVLCLGWLAYRRGKLRLDTEAEVSFFGLFWSSPACHIQLLGSTSQFFPPPLMA